MWITGGHHVEWRVVDDGVAQDLVCARKYGFFPSERQRVVEKTSDGFLISVDLWGCRSLSNHVEHLDWYVRIANVGSTRGVIEDLRLTSTARTQWDSVDSDHDRVSDSEELGLRDPVGVDADRDTLHESIDPDPLVPSWAPAFKLRSFDYRETLDVGLVDSLAPIVDFEAVGVYADGEEVMPLFGSAWYPGWQVDMDAYGGVPDALRLSWVDAYGGSGVVSMNVAEVGGELGIHEFSCEAVDAATGWEVFLEMDLEDQLVVTGETAVLAGALTLTVASPLPGDEVVTAGWALRVAGGWSRFGSATAGATSTMSVATQATVGLTAGVGLLAAGGLALESWDAADVERPSSQSTVQAQGMTVVLPGSVLAELAETGVSEEEIQRALQNAAGKVNNPLEATKRWFYEVDGVLYIILTTGTRAAQQLEWAYEVVLPSVDWNDGLSWEEVLALEAQLIKEAGEALKDALPELPAHRYGRPQQGDCKVPVVIEPLDARDNEPGTPVTYEMECIVWQGLLFNLEATDTIAKYVKQSSSNDAEVAMIVWRFTHANAGQLFATGLANWYWDDGNAPTDCSATPTPQVRRCIPSSFQMKQDKASLSDIEVDLPSLKATVPNYLDFHYLDFKEKEKPRLHRDALSAKGTVLTIEQLVDAEEGKDRLDWYYEQIEYLMTPTMANNAEADVKIPYVITHGGGGAMVSFDET